VNPKDRLLTLSTRLGIHFACPDIILRNIEIERGIFGVDLWAWLATEEAYEYVKQQYGSTLPLPGDWGIGTGCV
jgi:hypothetical protein